MKSERNDLNEKEQLIDLLIHDLAGPMSVVSKTITNLLQKSERYGPLTDIQMRVLGRALRNTRKAQTLLHELVEIYRSKEGIFQSEFFSVKQALEESLLEVLDIASAHAVERLSCAKSPEEFQQVLGEHGVFIEISGKYGEAPFCHDQKKVCQILRNLMGNALKYRRSKMNVSISGDTDLLICVEDDGRGIPEKDQQAIFDPFVRLTERINPAMPGLGLGLTGVKTLVEAMGGEITLESGEGLGACFKVKIPPLEDSRSNRKGGISRKESILDGKRILAVDDEADFLAVLGEEIFDASPSCQFDKATNFEKAYEMLERGTSDYDIVILDIMGVQGFDLLKLAVSRNFRVAMLTAHALSPEALKQSLEMGARAYLPKEKLGEIVPFLEVVLLYDYLPGWKRLLKKLEDFFNARWGERWEQTEADFWKEFNKKTTHIS